MSLRWEAQPKTSYFGVTKKPTQSRAMFQVVLQVEVQRQLHQMSVILHLVPIQAAQIRQPSAFCGITGMKPTYGTVSRYGLIAYGSSLDQIGPMTKNVTDCAAVLDTIASYDKKRQHFD